jgi:polyisoprenoid-binding protein YceI
MAQQANVERYAIDPAMSQFTVKAFVTGMFSMMGMMSHNPTIAIRGFSGEAEFAPATLEYAALHMKIDARSLAVTDNVSDKDRREMEQTISRDVLDVARYPEIVFDASNGSSSKAGDGYYLVRLLGDLSLHGVTHSQPVSVQIAVNGDILRAHGEFSVRQTDFGIKPVSVAGGALKLKDELKCTFDIVARRQGETS